MSQVLTTLVIGASEKPERYSNKAIRLLRHKNNDVRALGLRPGKVLDVTIETSIEVFKDSNIDTITLYINSNLQSAFYDAILNIRPRRVIFNPGTENPEFENLLTEHHIESEEACTLVLLNTGQY